MSEQERIETLKAQGVDVCDLHCATCKRGICTGAKEISGKARGDAERAEEETPTARAAIAAMDLCNMIDALPDEEAVKVVEVLKCRMAVSMLKASNRKAVSHG